MKENFLNNFKPYVHICQELLREFFTKVPDQMLPSLSLLIELYFNLTIEHSSLKSTVKMIEINIHRDEFKRMFEPPFTKVFIPTKDRYSLKSLDSPVPLSPLFYYLLCYDPMESKKFTI